jgi:hypothetical protein
MTGKAKHNGMRTRLLAAFAVLTSCVFLTSLSMPDAPRPQRRAKPQIQTFTEETRTAQGNQQTRSSTQVKRRDSAQKPNNNVQSLEDAEARAKRNQIDRSPRTTLPSKSLR